MTTLNFAIAEPVHAESLVSLINSAYRGETSKRGWTSEADLLDGYRTDLETIVSLLEHEDSMLLIGQEDDNLIATVHIQHQGDCASFGMLAVRPDRQNQGIGKRLLQAAEQKSVEVWQVKGFKMAIIPLRSELMAFYQRLGYQSIGVSIPFPQQPALWTAKVADLSLDILYKPA